MKKRLFSILKYCTAATLVVALVTGLTQTGFSPGKEAKAAETSSVMGSDNYVASIKEGESYKFGGCDWIAAKVWGKFVVLQSKGVTSGPWPGYTLEKWGNGHYYDYSIDDQDISSYDTTTQNLYNRIKYAEYGSSGLYLVSRSATRNTVNDTQGSGSYWQALKEAADDYRSFGADFHCAWLGTFGGYISACGVFSDGDVSDGCYQYYSCVVAPAFDLDKSKVTVSGSYIIPFSASTGIQATKKSSIQSIEEGESIDLSSVIGGVTYTGGDADGNNASYTVSCDKGTISGTTYTAPRDVAINDSTVTFTIKSTRNSGWTSSVQVNLAQKYVSVSYDVTTNGGTSATPSSITVDIDKDLDDSSPELTVGKDTVEKTGWTFVGWNTDQNANKPLDSLKMDSDYTLYAIFKKDLTVTFIDAGS